MVRHHANELAEVLVVLKDLVKTQQTIDFVLLLQEVLLERFDVVLLDLGLTVSYPGTSVDKLPLVHPE